MRQRASKADHEPRGRERIPAALGHDEKLSRDDLTIAASTIGFRIAMTAE